MVFLERLNRAVEYMEDRLAGDLDYQEAGRIACCSVYNFQRMFSYILDIPLSEYVRRRRMTLAAFELQQGDTKIIDLAIKYGYDSQDSFARAFQRFHGVTPSRARNRGVMLRAYPRVSFHISVGGDREMRYSIVDKEAFEVFGIEEIISSVGDPACKSVPAFWQKCHDSGAYERLFDAANARKRGEIYKGMCAINAALNYRNTGDLTFPYMLFAFTTEQSKPEGYTRVKIPTQTWAVFTSEEHGDDEIGAMTSTLWSRVFKEWLPTSGYRKLEGPDIEIYGSSGNGNYYSEVWIPVAKE
ncbi:MAG TPA: AraC family transcriptional regulator [Symbiobacteriaceae bacterium]|jgi:AraC family transcriptional regulator